MLPARLVLASLVLLGAPRAWAQEAPVQGEEQDPAAAPAGRAVEMPPSESKMYPLQIAGKLALRMNADRDVGGWGVIYGGLAFGSLGERWGAFWGVGAEAAGDLFCPTDSCAALNAGFSVRAGIAFRQTLAGHSYQGRYVYVSATPYLAHGDGGFDDMSEYGVRFALGFVNPLRLRMADILSELDPDGGLWFFENINVVELMYERCSDRSLHCPSAGVGLLIGTGF